MEVLFTEQCSDELKNLYRDALEEYSFMCNKGNAGLDLRYSGKDTLVIPPNNKAGVVKVNTGIRIWLDNRLTCGFVYPRSGLGSKGLALANTVGVIDSSYQGEIILMLVNNSNEDIIINPNDRIAQYVIQSINLPFGNLQIVDKHFSNETERGSTGFGASGVA